MEPMEPRTMLAANINYTYSAADILHFNDGDLQNDIAFSYVFSEPRDGKQTVDVYLAANDGAGGPKPSARRSSRPSRFRSSATSLTSRRPATSRSSPVLAVMRSSSTSTGSRTSSTPRVSATSQN